MKLHYSPGSCALGIHVLLEETGAPFTLARIDFAAREQYGEAYRALNPKSKVPLLQLDDGSVLTEFQAIATYLARTHTEKPLIPSSPLARRGCTRRSTMSSARSTRTASAACSVPTISRPTKPTTKR